jgi:hypothetical protein
MVFDGSPLPSKRITDVQRTEERRKYQKLGQRYLDENDGKMASDCFQKAVHISKTMIRQFIAVICALHEIDLPIVCVDNFRF